MFKLLMLGLVSFFLVEKFMFFVIDLFMSGLVEFNLCKIKV